MEVWSLGTNNETKEIESNLIDIVVVRIVLMGGENKKKHYQKTVYRGELSIG
jgi:hypothetical protein